MNQIQSSDEQSSYNPNSSDSLKGSKEKNESELISKMEGQDNNDNSKAPAQAFLGDLTDGRNRGAWKTRYESEAHKEICWERNYLLSVLSASLIIPLLIGLIISKFYGVIPQEEFVNFKRYVFALFGGILGGTLFSIKWLVHSVAKNTWNIDRRLWRIFTPFLSGSLALSIILLINAEIFKFTTAASLTIHKCFGIGFLVGYFSDNAIGKLTEIAQVFFGSSMSQRK